MPSTFGPCLPSISDDVMPRAPDCPPFASSSLNVTQWDALGDEYASSSSVLIADVDCTVEQDLCSEYDVKGYPTIKYFTSETDAKGADYSGGRSAEDLKSFVSENLEVKCLLEDTAGCTEKETEFMGKWKASAQRRRRCGAHLCTPYLLLSAPHAWLTGQMRVTRTAGEAKG